MSGLTRILCAVNFSRPAQAAFEQAVALSRDRDAELTVVHAVPVSERSNWRARERIAKTAALRAAAARARVRLRVTEQHGDPAGVILLHANAGGFDLVVLGTHGRTGVGRLRVGSIAEQVTQRARCPVLIVPMSEVRRKDPALFRNIVCPVDFTQGSYAALDRAIQLTSGGGRLTLLHVSRPLDPVSASRYAYHSGGPDTLSRCSRTPGSDCKAPFRWRREQGLMCVHVWCQARRPPRS